jgi:hypothetical protein
VKLTIFFGEISSLMTENIKFTPILFPHQSMYAMPNHLPIICLKASPFQAIGVLKGTIIEKWICSTRTYDMQNSE